MSKKEIQSNKIVNADSLNYLKTLDSCSIDAVVTDPPYGLSSNKGVSETLLKWLEGDLEYTPKGKGFMGHEWDSFVPPPALWSEVFRVLKEGGHALIFAGSRTQDLMGLSLRLSGFEVRDCIQWIYGGGFPKSLNIEKAINKQEGEEKGDAKRWSGWGTALKPAYEPVLLVRKPFKCTVAQNVLEHGTGGLNIDKCRVGETGGTKCLPKEGADYTVYSKGLGGGKASINKGRFPANLILNEDVEGGDWKSWFFCPKASRKERGEGNNHPTVKPIELMRYLCRLITPPNGVVLDPFMGSGTTIIASYLEGFNFLGIERELEFFKIAQSRLEEYEGKEYEEDKEDKGGQVSLFH